MTAKSFWWETGVAGDGSSTYTEIDHSRWARVVGACFGHEGIGPGYGNEFDAEANPTGGTDRKVRIKTGGTIVDGKPLDQDVTEDHLLDVTPNLRRDRIVLKCDWSVHTVRIAVLKGTDGVDTPPNIPAPNPNTLVYQALWDVKIVSSGAVTLEADERVWAVPQVDDATIDIILGILGVKAGGIDTAELANDSVDDTKAGNRVPQFYRRQGGHSSDWEDQGNTNYTPGPVRIQAGSKNWSGTPTDTGSVVVTFPVAFSNVPLGWAVSKSALLNCGVNLTATTMEIFFKVVEDVAVVSVANFYWLAIGPE